MNNLKHKIIDELVSMISIRLFTDFVYSQENYQTTFSSTGMIGCVKSLDHRLIEGNIK